MLDGEYLVMLASLEKGSDANKSNFIIPHDDVPALFDVAWNDEGVLEYCMVLSVSVPRGRVMVIYREKHHGQSWRAGSSSR